MLLLSKHYVYYHIDPKSNKIQYIGKGSGGRAWQCNPTDRPNQAHYEWIKELLEAGYTPDDFVQIVEKNVSSQEAHKIESKMIRRWKPQFNDYGTVIDTILTNEQQTQILALRAKKVSYHKIAEQLGTTAMTIHRFYKQRLNLEKNNGQ